MERRYPKTYNCYLKRFRDMLLQRRSGWYQKAKDRLPFYIMFAIGDYTFAPWKVVWTRVGTDITGAVVGQKRIHGQLKPVMPADTSVLVGFNQLKEAHYFCAVLNSAPWRFVIISTAVHGTGGFGSPNVLQKARIPKYDSADPVHRGLAKASKEAHEATAEGDKSHLAEIEERIDALAAELWGLTDAELAEIHKSLKELL